MEFKTRENGAVSIIELAGRFDAYQVPQVTGWFEKAWASIPARIVVNLAGVNFLDSTALATLVKGMKHCRQNQGDLVICQLQQPVRIIFELTRLDRAINIFASEDEAVKFLAENQSE